MPEDPHTRRRLRPALSMELIEEASKLFKAIPMKSSPINCLSETPRKGHDSSKMEPMPIGNSNSSSNGGGSNNNDDGSKHQTSPFVIIARSPGLSFVFLISILQNAGLSVVVPSLALRLEAMAASPQLLGIIAAAAPLVSVISPTLTGFLADRVPKRITQCPYTWVYFLSMICFVGGNILQTFARAPIVLGIARAIIGISTGSSAIGISHVSRELRDPSERMSVVSVFSGVEMMGYILGTATGGLLSSVDTNFFGLLHIDGFTAPTIFPAIAGIVLTIGGLPGFARSEKSINKERQRERSELKLLKRNKWKNSFIDPENNTLNGGSGNSSHDGEGLGTFDIITTTSSPLNQFDHEEVKLFLTPQARTYIQAIVIFLYCLASAMYNAFETTSTPITGIHFGWGVRENAFLWTISGFIGCITSVCIAHIPHSTILPSDFLIVGLIFAIIGPLFMLLSFSHDSINNHTGTLKIRDVNSSISEMRIPLFWFGFLLCDIANVIFESIFTLLFSTLVESNIDDGNQLIGNSNGDDVKNDHKKKDNDKKSDEEDEDADIEEEENKNEAFLFGLFNSIGWFLGCALGAIFGNMLFLISTKALLLSCSSCAIFILLVTICVRKSLFSIAETGYLLRKINQLLTGNNNLNKTSSTLGLNHDKSNGGGGSGNDLWEGHSSEKALSLSRRQNSSIAP